MNIHVPQHTNVVSGEPQGKAMCHLHASSLPQPRALAGTLPADSRPCNSLGAGSPQA